MKLKIIEQDRYQKHGRLDTCPLSGEVQIQIEHRAAFSNWNRLVTVLCGRRSNTAPAAFEVLQSTE
jgi:hypothetical protein